MTKTLQSSFSNKELGR